MKKIVGYVLLVMMILTVCVSACAVSFDNFKIDITGTSDLNYRDVPGGAWSASKTGSVNLYHSVIDDGSGYNNHFRVYVNGASSANASAWCTPGKNIPISCKAIKKIGDSVTMKARGNTKYVASYDDYYITIRGSFGKRK